MLRNVMLTVLLPILIAVVLRVFFLEIYKIPSSSMEPTLLNGDIILVGKMNYGTRLLKLGMLLREKKMEYTRLKGWNRIRKGDIFVFNWPQYNTYTDSLPNIYGGVVVKRCYGMPGDSVRIKKERGKESGIEAILNSGTLEDNSGGILFPHDTTLYWSVDDYGPLYVPAGGDSMNFSARNKKWYKDVLLFENHKDHSADSLIRLQAGTLTQYTFRNNYYFMVGDNFYNSQDSRYWGFVPEGNIIGKAVMVLCSFDPHNSGLGKIRWNRFFHRIKTPTIE
jgi:signal peptidase I